MMAAKRKKGRRPVEVSDEDYKPIPTFGRPFVASERDSLEEEALEEQEEEEEEEAGLLACGILGTCVPPDASVLGTIPMGTDRASG